MGNPKNDINEALAWTPDPQLRGEAAHIRAAFADDPVRVAQKLRNYLKSGRDILDPAPPKEASFLDIVSAKPVSKMNQEDYAEAMNKLED